MPIIDTTVNDTDVIARIISESNKDVAENFGITWQNNPKHPSFCTTDWVLKDFERGEEYFVYQQKGESVGCVAFESPREGVAYLNRLSVLPGYRHQGIGEALVNHIFLHAESKGIHNISIGIIAEHERLKQWYLKLGFTAGEIKEFSHLPFDVLFMHYSLSKRQALR